MGNSPRSVGGGEARTRPRRVATREGSKWQHATFWQSHAQLEPRRCGTHWWPSSPPRTTPPYTRQRWMHCWRAPPRGKMQMLPRGARTTSTIRGALRRHQLPQSPFRPRKRRSTTCSPSIHHPHRHRAGGSGRGMPTFWRRMVDEPDAFPPEFWQIFLQSSLTALGEKC